jgi:hypothetical protein
MTLAIPESAEFDHPSSVIYFSVDDIQRAFEVLTKRGVRFEGQPHLIAKMEGYDLWMAFFRDGGQCLEPDVQRAKKVNALKVFRSLAETQQS